MILLGQNVSLVESSVLKERFLSPGKRRAGIDSVIIPCAARKPELFALCSSEATEGRNEAVEKWGVRRGK